MHKELNCLNLVSAALALLVIFVCPGLQAADSTPAKPSVLLAGLSGAPPDFEFARWLDRDGFKVRTLPGASLEERALTWDDVKSFNVVVVFGIGMANSDMSLSATNKQTIETLNRFMNEGGSVLYMPVIYEFLGQIPPQTAFLKPLGLTPLFEEMVADPATATVGVPPYRTSFAHTTQIAPSPITDGVTSLWYPIGLRQGTTTPFSADNSWHVVVTGSPTSHTHTVSLEQNGTGQEGDPGKIKSLIPLVAYREVGKGRLIYYGIDPLWLWSPHAGDVLGGVVRDKGLNGMPSQGYVLFRNSLNWLAQSSLGGTTLGGAEADANLLKNSNVTDFEPPFDWSKAPQTFQPSPRQCPGVIGTQTVLSGGHGTVEDWVKEARARGLSYIVFLEDFANLSPEKLAQLRSECARMTDANFAAVPGFRIQDEVNNRYFFCGANVFYPPKNYLTADGKAFTTFDPDLHSPKGQLSMTLLDYAYTLGGFKLTSGDYLFHAGTAFCSNYFSDYTSVGVITRQHGKVIEDATHDFLEIAHDGQGPLPMVIDLMSDPSELSQTPWHTVLCINPGHDAVGAGDLPGPNPVLSYFNLWHFFPDDPMRIYITSGPKVDYWTRIGPDDYNLDTNGDFVWQNYRCRLGGSVSSDVGLKEVALYDGNDLYRRFLPHGAKTYQFALDFTHNKQHDIVLIATDLNGNRAITSEKWDRNQRLYEVQCADRNNQLMGGYQTRKDGTAINMHSDPAMTAEKRVPVIFFDPAAAFMCDKYLGANCFDGGLPGTARVNLPMNLLPQTGGEELPPMVGTGTRLLHTGDTHIGDFMCDRDFTDGVLASSVWRSLWRSEPTKDFTVDRRNQMFRVDPENSISAYLVCNRVTLKHNLSNKGIEVISFDKGDSTKWVVRGSDGKILSGGFKDPATPVTKQQAPFGVGGYVGMLDTGVGSAAVFSLSPGMKVSWEIPNPGKMNIDLDAASSPQKRGESVETDVLLLGFPRLTDETKSVSTDTTATLARFGSDFGLTTPKPSYTVDVQAGKIIDQHYILSIDGSEAQAFSGELSGDLISSLPISVSGMNNHWTSMLFDRQEGKARPLGVFENKTWATITLHGKSGLFVGHPVTCDQPKIVLQFTQIGEHAWRLEVHNPTSTDLKVKLRANPFFDPLKGKTLPSEPVAVKAGTSCNFDL